MDTRLATAINRAAVEAIALTKEERARPNQKRKVSSNRLK